MTSIMISSGGKDIADSLNPVARKKQIATAGARIRGLRIVALSRTANSVKSVTQTSAWQPIHTIGSISAGWMP